MLNGKPLAMTLLPQNLEGEDFPLIRSIEANVLNK